MAPSSEVTILHAVPNAYQFGLWNKILIARWERSADATAVSYLNEISNTFRTAHPDGRQSGIHIVLEGVGLPTPEARASLSRLMKSKADQIGAIAILIRGSGFAAGAIRSFLAALRFAAPRSFEFGVHSKTSDVLRWLHDAHLRQTGEDIDRSELERALSSFAANYPFK